MTAVKSRSGNVGRIFCQVTGIFHAVRKCLRLLVRAGLEILGEGVRQGERSLFHGKLGSDAASPRRTFKWKLEGQGSGSLTIRRVFLGPKHKNLGI